MTLLLGIKLLLSNQFFFAALDVSCSLATPFAHQLTTLCAF